MTKEIEGRNTKTLFNSYLQAEAHNCDNSKDAVYGKMLNVGSI